MKTRKTEPACTRHKLLKCGLCLMVFFSLLFSIAISEAATPVKKNKPRPKGEKIYLIHADTLRYKMLDNPNANILNGNVEFLHGNVKLYCDSAYFYKETNSFEAFSNVKMVQGDTLSLTSEYLKYDGDAQIAQARKNVHLKHRESLLITDSLNYDRLYDLGYFFDGGRLYDNDNVLTSDWGEYSPQTREAIFNYNVKLTNLKFVLTSDTLHYNTLTKLTHIIGPSNINSDGSRIYTERGFYNTNTDYAELYDRSVVINGTSTMTGDSMFYDKQNGDMRAYKNIIYNDKENKNLLTGDICIYNEKTGYAMATDSAVVRDYSGTDTLFMHADTFKIFTYNINTDSVYRQIHGYHHARAFRVDVQSVCDSLKYDSQEKRMTMYGNPIVWSNNQQLLGEVIYVYMNDSTIDSAHVERQALLAEKLDSMFYNQVAGREMFAYFKDGQMDWSKVVGNVDVAYYPYDSDSIMIGLNRMQTSEMRMYMKNRKMNKIWSAPAEGTLYPLNLAPQEQFFLSNFAWFDYIRPKDKHDIFVWREKAAGTELRETIRRTAPLQTLSNILKRKTQGKNDVKNESRE